MITAILVSYMLFATIPPEHDVVAEIIVSCAPAKQEPIACHLVAGTDHSGYTTFLIDGVSYSIYSPECVNCPWCPEIFADNFERGDLSRWDVVIQ